MSQAFVKEGDQSDDLPERPLSALPNYVTPAGLAALKAKVEELSRRRAELKAAGAADTDPVKRMLERDLRYFEARLSSAVLIERKGPPPADVRFGAEVELEGTDGRRRVMIVGEDEADPERGKLSWSSPLAMSLVGAKPGDSVAWPTQGGEERLRVVFLAYP